MKQFTDFFHLTEGKYFGRFAAGAIIHAEDTGTTLVLQRAKNKSGNPNRKVKEPGTWSITVSGAIDRGEKPKAAAIREMKEELGYRGPFEISTKPLDVFKDNEHDFTFYTYLIRVPKEFTPKLNWENDAYTWVDKLKNVPKPVHFGTTRLIRLRDLNLAFDANKPKFMKPPRLRGMQFPLSRRSTQGSLDL